MVWSLVRGAAALVGVIALSALVRQLFRGGAIEVGLRRARRSKLGRKHDEIGPAAAYHEKLPAVAREDSLDDRTWRDLDLDDVFLAIDHTVSQPGRQYFYHLLRTPSRDVASLAALERAIDRVSHDADLADTVRAT